jgi:hypothetical protein
MKGRESNTTRAFQKSFRFDLNLKFSHRSPITWLVNILLHWLPPIWHALGSYATPITMLTEN